jgi:hypothetical protein
MPIRNALGARICILVTSACFRSQSRSLCSQYAQRRPELQKQAGHQNHIEVVVTLADDIVHRILERSEADRTVLTFRLALIAAIGAVAHT